MSEDSRSVLERFSTSVRKVEFSNGQLTFNARQQSLENLVQVVIHEANRLHEKAGGNHKALYNYVMEESRAKSALAVVQTNLKVYEARDQRLFDEHSQLKRIEHGQGLRTLIWRAATTFTIASIIFFFYCLADYLEISMPLSRVAL